MSRFANCPQNHAASRSEGLLHRLGRLMPDHAATLPEPSLGFASRLAEMAAARSLWNAPRYWLS
jgi:hypothetical protein